MFIGPCLIAIVDELKTNMMSLAILFHLLCAQHVLHAEACKTNTTKYQPHQNLQHTTKWEQDDRCGSSSTQLQAPEDGYINVRNMLST